MLRLIPPPLHRALYRLADRARRIWWQLRRPRRRSAIVIAFDEAGRVLMVRHSYGPRQWGLPGGGMARGEEPAAGAAREFAEELQCPIADLREFRSETQPDSGSLDERHVFAARLAGMPVPDRREIVEVGLFDPAALPAGTPPRIARFIAEAAALRERSQ